MSTITPRGITMDKIVTDERATLSINRVRVSVVVPSWSGEIGRLRASLESQTCQDYELIVIAGVSPAGRARNQGVARARGEIIVFIDDDAYFGHDRVLEKLLTILDSDPAIGVVGSSKLIPPDANWFQRRTAAEVPRWVYPVVDQDTESNPPLDHYGYTGITTTCCALRRSLFEELAGFDEQFVTGEDTELFHRIGRCGYRFVIPQDCWVYHEPPKRLRDLLYKSFGYGMGHVQEAKMAPERRMEIVRLNRWHGQALVVVSPLLLIPSIFLNLYFDPVRHWRIGFFPLKAVSTFAALCGYVLGWYRYERLQRSNIGDFVLTSSKMPPKQASASRSSTLSGLTFLGVAVLNNLYAIVMALLLPVHSYGVLGLAQSWLLIAATLLNSGFPWELARVLARDTSLREAYRTAKSAFVGNVVLALSFCAALLLVVAFGGLRFGANDRILVGLILAETPLLALNALWAGVLQGSLRFGMLGLSRVVEVLIKVMVGVALVLFGFGAEGAFGAMVLGTIFSLLLLGWGTRRFAFWRERSWGDWRMYRSSLIIFVGLCALTIVGNIDIIGVKLFSPAQEADTLAGYYQAAAVLARIPLLLAGAYATALFPYLSRARDNELPIYVAGALKYTLILIAPLNLILIAVPESAILLFFPAAYRPSAEPLRIAALGTLLLALTTVFATALQARGLAGAPARWLPIAAIIEIAALWLLTPILGIIGASLALLLASLIACVGLAVVFLGHFTCRVNRRGVLGYLLANTVLVVGLIVLPHSNPAWTVISALIALSVYLILLALTGILRPSDLTTLTAGLPLERIPWLASARACCLRIVEHLNRFRFRDLHEYQ